MNSQLHGTFLCGQQQRFQRILESAKTPASSNQNASASLGSSGGTPSRLSGSSIDVNARDDQGRTVLHLACASLERSSLECVRLLLGHPAIQVNIQDTESHWTPLHRAMYAGNIEATLLLLQRPDIDLKLKDYEGYTAFDLFNSTVEGTVPERGAAGDVFTWGSNRNSTLGHGDSDDRTLPDLVDLPYEDVKSGKQSLFTKFSSVPVHAIAMARLHTAIVTAEPQRNLRLCGIASAGRLGPSPSATAPGSVQIQFALAPLAALPHAVVTVALGQDHSLAVTTAAEVFSWGSNRAGQLGYAIEAAAGSAPDIQAVPRKIAGNLRKEKINGVAACRTASACWTSEGFVYTWGTNNGQLGHDRTNMAIQAAPRRVTTLEEPVASVALSDLAMACLLRSSEVLMFWRDAHFKLAFPVQGFPASMTAPIMRKAIIVKVASCEGAFVALSDAGAVYTFSSPVDSATEATRTVKPQRVWDVRKWVSKVKDVAIGLDGAIVLCTESGHVFLRQPNIKAAQGLAKPAKFQKMSHLQRITNVAASPTGAFAALRIDSKPESVKVEGESMTEQMGKVAPYWGTAPRPRVELQSKTPPTVLGSGKVRIVFSSVPQVLPPRGEEGAEDDDGVDARVRRDILGLGHLCDILDKLRARNAENKAERQPLTAEFPHGGDVAVQIQGTDLAFPAHLVVLLARCPALRTVLAGTPARDTAGGVSIRAPSSHKHATIAFAGVQPLAVLLLLEYAYTDEVILAWEPRVALALEAQYRAQRVRPGQLRSELQALARALGMDELERSLGRVFPTPPPTLAAALSTAMSSTELLDVADVTLQLKDREVRAHSAVLRARSLFFAFFLDDPVWTVSRRGADGKDVLMVKLEHLSWREMEYVMRYLYADAGEELFNDVDFVKSGNELIDFYFAVLAAADELLLEKLILICSSAILRRLNIWNACSLLTDASQHFAQPLTRSIQSYIARNLETMLEGRMLDTLEHDTLKQLGIGLRARQADKARFVRSPEAMDALLGKWALWLDEQDIPRPIVRSGVVGAAVGKKASKGAAVGVVTSPTLGARRSSDVAPLTNISPLPSPTVVPTDYKAPVSEDIFDMDELVPAASSVQPTPTASSSPPVGSGFAWKTPSTTTPRTDLRAIIAETMSANTQPRPSPPAASTPRPTQELKSRSSLGSVSAAVTSGSPGPAWRMSAAPPSPLAGPSGATRPAAPTPRASGSTPSSIGRAAGAAVAPMAKAGNPTPTPPARQSSATAVPRAIPGSSDARNRPASVQTTTSLPTMPRRPSSPTLGIRRVSGQRGAAWAPLTAQPTAEPEPVATGPVVSFAAIQQQERDRLVTVPKPKQNLREIQEEQARVEAARAERQAEEDFQRWWAQEELRVQMEEQRLALAQARQSSGGGGGGGGRRGGRSGGSSSGGGATAPAAGDSKPAKSGGRKKGPRKAGGGAAPGSVPARIDD